MTQQRKTNPLPIGRYWLMVNGPTQLQDWAEWTNDMGKSVQVESTEETPADGDKEGHAFVIFRVKDNAAFFPVEKFGFPDKAPSSIRFESDVVKAPNVDTPDLGTFLQGLITVGKWTAIGLVSVGVVNLLAISRKRG